MGYGAGARIAGTLVMPGTQGSWQLWGQEIWLASITRSGEVVCLAGICRACLCSFHSIQTVTDQPLHSPTAASVSTECPDMGTSPLHQVQVWFCSLSSFSLPSFILSNFTWIYILLSRGQGLLPAFSWCSARSSSPKNVPDASMERDVLPVHLLLLHLVSLTHTNYSLSSSKETNINLSF